MEVAQANKQVEDPLLSRFSWAIQNFSRLNKKKHYSNIFIVRGYKWRVLIFPKGNNVDYLSVYLDVADWASLPIGWSRDVQFSMAVIDQIHNKHTVRKDLEHQFNALETDWGLTYFMPLSDLYDRSKGYLVNDTLVIEADIGSSSKPMAVVAADQEPHEQGKGILASPTATSSTALVGLAPPHVLVEADAVTAPTNIEEVAQPDSDDCISNDDDDDDIMPNHDDDDDIKPNRDDRSTFSVVAYFEAPKLADISDSDMPFIQKMHQGYRQMLVDRLLALTPNQLVESVKELINPMLNMLACGGLSFRDFYDAVVDYLHKFEDANTLLALAKARRASDPAVHALEEVQAQLDTRLKEAADIGVQLSCIKNEELTLIAEVADLERALQLKRVDLEACRTRIANLVSAKAGLDADVASINSRIEVAQAAVNDALAAVQNAAQEADEAFLMARERLESFR